jgi:site-specific recombinase XerD
MGPVVPDLVPFEKYITSIRSKTTAEHYVTSTTLFLKWLESTLGPVPLTTLPRNILSQYAQSLLEAGYLSGTVHAHLAGVKRYFRWVSETANVEFPPFYRPELPRGKRKVKDALSSEMLSHFFRVASELDEPLRTAVMLLPCSGLRSNEMVTLPLAALKRSPFQLSNGTTKDTLCLQLFGKGGHERIVPLLDEGAEILMHYLRTWRRTHDDKLYMFPGRHSGHLSTRAVRDAVQKIRVGFRAKWTPHTLRRTYLTALYRKGVDPTILAKIAGHSDVQILIDHYLALDEHDVVSAVHSTGGRLAP